ncbi:MAG: GNAT family N-acetyltransferase [Proteobacteria bacterium]|nr:GNAT family N-acetyltransferase [Pseudomonadota bacterium]
MVNDAPKAPKPAGLRIALGADEWVAAWVRRQIPGLGPFGPCTTMAIVDGREIIAGVVYNNYHDDCYGRPHAISISLAATHPRWCSRRTLRTIFAYPFSQLGVRRLQATVAKKNRRVRKLLEGVGFVLEGKGREAWPDCGDAMFYSMLRHDADRWLVPPSAATAMAGMIEEASNG